MESKSILENEKVRGVAVRCRGSLYHSNIDYNIGKRETRTKHSPVYFLLLTVENRYTHQKKNTLTSTVEKMLILEQQEDRVILDCRDSTRKNYPSYFISTFIIN
jgi:hypothetical protein